MSYIIVWRNNHREPHLNTNSNDFIETYSTFEEAENEAKEIYRNENDNEKSPWYFDYQIYQLATS